MASKEETERFLLDFKHKLGFWGLIFRSDRDKNFKTLTTLEYQVKDVKKELNELEVSHYSQGPVVEALFNGAAMWVFGKSVQGKEVYIKITMGQPSDRVICISFHFAEHVMKYPYKIK
ncbi:MAG: type II toxin-antitoxin system MqsR family toxin [Flammeovirgaceae bacterium]|nr:type II toxin-antitoxin system MqsR family toxin [Flammeovirgaceae bacterium]